MQGCSWPRPTSRNALGDPGAGKEPPNEATESTEGCRSNEPHAEGAFLPLCPQRGARVLPSPAALWVAGATAAALPLHSSDLWMFAHSCLLMCLITKRHWDGAPAGLLSPFPCWESALSPCRVGAHTSQRSENKSPAHAPPAMPLLGTMGIPPLDTSESKRLMSSQGRRQSPLPAGYGEKERCLRAEPCFPWLPGWHAAC